MQRIKTMRVVAAMMGLAASSMLVGCGMGAGSGLTVPTEIHGTAIHGTVFGGQQPVVGAAIKFYMAGTGGYGVAPTYTTGTGNLLTATVTSGAGGMFDVTGDYTCPSAATPVYLVATGGNSGYTTNNRIALMAALGACGNLANASVNINEITTVASVYSLASFMTGITNISTSAANVTGLNNAFADVNLLSNVGNGTTPGVLPAGLTVPTTEINTLADIVASCVNTAGGSYNDGSNCGTLFYNANPGGTAGTAPTDTITALMNIAQHPASSASNVSALYGLALQTPPFQPTLAATPNDFTLALTMTGGVAAPSALAADLSGNIFVTNSGSNSVTEYGHGGAVLSGAGYTNGFNAPSSIAIDAGGILWVTNQGNASVSRLTAAGAAYGAPLTGGGLSQPRSVAIDSLGNAWVANVGNTSVTVINNAGTTLTNYTPAGATGPLAIGVNPH